MNKVLEVLKNNKGIVKKVLIGAAAVAGVGIVASLMKPEEPEYEVYVVEETETEEVQDGFEGQYE